MQGPMVSGYADVTAGRSMAERRSKLVHQLTGVEAVMSQLLSMIFVNFLAYKDEGWRLGMLQTSILLPGEQE